MGGEDPGRASEGWEAQLREDTPTPLPGHPDQPPPLPSLSGNLQHEQYLVIFSWNARGLWVARAGARIRKLTVLRKLLRLGGLVCIQESHLDAGNWEAFTTWTSGHNIYVLGGPSSTPTGGLVVLSLKPLTDGQVQEVEAGHLQLLANAKTQEALGHVYLSPRSAAVRRAQIARIGHVAAEQLKTWADQATPLDRVRYTFIGDMNFVEKSEDRFYPLATVSRAGPQDVGSALVRDCITEERPRGQVANTAAMSYQLPDTDLSPQEQAALPAWRRRWIGVPNELQLEQGLEEIWEHLIKEPFTLVTARRRLETHMGVVSGKTDVRAPLIRALVERKIGPQGGPERVFRARAGEDRLPDPPEQETLQQERPFYGHPDLAESRKISEEWIPQGVGHPPVELKTNAYTFRHRAMNVVARNDRAYVGLKIKGMVKVDLKSMFELCTPFLVPLGASDHQPIGLRRTPEQRTPPKGRRRLPEWIFQHKSFPGIFLYFLQYRAHKRGHSLFTEPAEVELASHLGLPLDRVTGEWTFELLDLLETRGLPSSWTETGDEPLHVDLLRLEAVEETWQMAIGAIWDAAAFLRDKRKRGTLYSKNGAPPLVVRLYVLELVLENWAKGSISAKQWQYWGSLSPEIHSFATWLIPAFDGGQISLYLDALAAAGHLEDLRSHARRLEKEHEDRVEALEEYYEELSSNNPKAAVPPEAGEPEDDIVIIDDEIKTAFAAGDKDPWSLVVGRDRAPAVAALVDPANGQPTQQHTEMFALYNADMKALRSERTTDWEKVEEWLENFPRRVPSHLRGEYQIIRQAALTRLRKIKKACPGPDGLPFGVYSILRGVFAGLFAGLGNALSSTLALPESSLLGWHFHRDSLFSEGKYEGKGELRAGLSFTDLYPLGKKASQTLADGTPAYSPDQTRKIEVGQTRRRIVTDLSCDQVEEAYEAIIDPKQAAWLRHRM